MSKKSNEIFGTIVEVSPTNSELLFDFSNYHSYTIDALVDTDASYSLAKSGVLPPDKWVLTENPIILKLANGQLVTNYGI